MIEKYIPDLFKKMPADMISAIKDAQKMIGEEDDKEESDDE